MKGNIVDWDDCSQIKNLEAQNKKRKYFLNLCSLISSRILCIFVKSISLLSKQNVVFKNLEI